jgi:hypothetical protein
MAPTRYAAVEPRPCSRPAAATRPSSYKVGGQATLSSDTCAWRLQQWRSSRTWSPRGQEASDDGRLTFRGQPQLLLMPSTANTSSSPHALSSTSLQQKESREVCGLYGVSSEIPNRVVTAKTKNVYVLVCWFRVALMIAHALCSMSSVPVGVSTVHLRRQTSTGFRAKNASNVVEGCIDRQSIHLLRKSELQTRVSSCGGTVPHQQAGQDRTRLYHKR